MVSSSDKNRKQNQLAQESEKTQKMREKLRKKLEGMDAKITKEALERKSLEIHRWISLHASSRITLKEKITLFDNNENAAQVSEKISKLAKQIQTDSE